MKYIHGQRVTCEIWGVKIDDAKISIDENDDVYICQDIKYGECVANNFGYKYSWGINKGTDVNLRVNGITNLRPIERTLRDMVVGEWLWEM